MIVEVPSNPGRSMMKMEKGWRVFVPDPAQGGLHLPSHITGKLLDSPSSPSILYYLRCTELETKHVRPKCNRHIPVLMLQLKNALTLWCK